MPVSGQYLFFVMKKKSPENCLCSFKPLSMSNDWHIKTKNFTKSYHSACKIHIYHCNFFLCTFFLFFFFFFLFFFYKSRNLENEKEIDQKVRKTTRYIGENITFCRFIPYLNTFGVFFKICSEQRKNHISIDHTQI
jgi:hypothetical protein